MKNSSILSVIERNYQKVSGLSEYERFVFKKILHCKTEPVPNLYTQCDSCETVHPVMKSCKDRLCPVCNGAASLKWIAKREQELLPVKYFFLTFTIPKQLRPVFLINKKACYDLLFKAVSSTVLECIQNNNRTFQGHAGFFTVLHTWDQRVNYHPHLHVVIPAGCLSPDKTAWNKSHDNFLLPVKKVSVYFRKKLIGYLTQQQKQHLLTVPKAIPNIQALFISLQSIPWVVHSRAPGKKGRPEHILRYLSRYVQKTAICDRRIVKIENGQVYIKYYDRKRKVPKTEIIPEMLFLKRLAMHILPKGFQKVRFYGFMANRHKSSQLALCRMLLGTPIREQEKVDKEILEDVTFLFWKYFRVDISKCPDCGKGHISIIKGPIKGG